MTQSAARGLAPTEWLLVALGVVGLAGTWAHRLPMADSILI